MTNGNDRGGTDARRRRREWLVATYRADVDVLRGAAAETWWRQNYRYDAYEQGWVERGSIVNHRIVVGDVPDFTITTFTVPHGEGATACRCYRCGTLLTVDTVTVDRIVPKVHGGTYRRSNIRPACLRCNSSTGGQLAAARRRRAA